MVILFSGCRVVLIVFFYIERLIGLVLLVSFSWLIMILFRFCVCRFDGMWYSMLMFGMLIIVCLEMLVNWVILWCFEFGIVCLEWYSSMFGWMLIECSFFIECWVGLVFSLLVVLM